MKKLFSILVLALACSALSAQQTTVALLNHEGTISTFYGSEALVQAHKAAVHGDAITLSGGSFNAPSSWTKAVTLRGAGCYEGADNSREVTYIATAHFYLTIPADIVTPIVIEGVSFKSYSFNYSSGVNNSTFLKCHFTGYLDEIRGNANFYNCVLEKYLTFCNTPSTNVKFYNCYVNDPTGTGDAKSVKFTNCVLRFSREIDSSREYRICDLEYATYHNCIFVGKIKSDNNRKPSEINIPKNCAAYNCLSCYCAYTPAIDTDTETKDAVYDYNIFDNMGNTTNKYLENGKALEDAIKSAFKMYNGTDAFSFDELYELTDEAKAKYLGSDGTQVGLYGGMGFDLVPSTLQITKCEVAPRSTKDGKLSVKIEVGIPE